MRQRLDEIVFVDLGGVGRDVALGEDLRVARGVDRGDDCSALLERLRDARGTSEEVERGAGVGVLADARQNGNQAPLGSEVLDHEAARAESSSASRSSRTNACAASGPPPFSRRDTSALPTITPSA